MIFVRYFRRIEVHVLPWGKTARRYLFHERIDEVFFLVFVHANVQLLVVTMYTSEDDVAIVVHRCMCVCTFVCVCVYVCMCVCWCMCFLNILISSRVEDDVVGLPPVCTLSPSGQLISFILL